MTVEAERCRSTVVTLVEEPWSWRRERRVHFAAFHVLQPLVLPHAPLERWVLSKSRAWALESTWHGCLCWLRSVDRSGAVAGLTRPSHHIWRPHGSWTPAVCGGFEVTIREVELHGSGEVLVNLGERDLVLRGPEDLVVELSADVTVERLAVGQAPRALPACACSPEIASNIGNKVAAVSGPTSTAWWTAGNPVAPKTTAGIPAQNHLWNALRCSDASAGANNGVAVHAAFIGHSRELTVVVVGTVRVTRSTQVAEIAQTLRDERSVSSLTNRRQQDRNEQRDDRNDHQQLNDREALLIEAVHVPTSPFCSPQACMKSPNQDVTGTEVHRGFKDRCSRPAGWTRTGADLWRQAREAVSDAPKHQ